MGCLIVLFALIGPRAALVFVWLTTNFISRAYDGFLLPFVGFLLAPWTTLVYALVHDGRGVTGFGWFCVALAVLADLSSSSASARQGYQYQQC
ncbi:MAG: hypothetical protein OEW42_15830 [Acidimicrobiia bacterium]|nr:hypothetical protein [Acidimicrobiia bacterium]MDH5238435.1 hypothetical protein [Acidimicrobiia bacterium]